MNELSFDEFKSNLKERLAYDWIIYFNDDPFKRKYEIGTFKKLVYPYWIKDKWNHKKYEYLYDSGVQELTNHKVFNGKSLIDRWENVVFVEKEKGEHFMGEGKIKLKEKVVSLAKEAKAKIGEVAEKTGEQAKEIVADTGEKIKDLKDKAEKMLFNPITLDEYRSANYNVPKLVRMLDKDTHEGLESCAGAIGYESTIAKMKVFEIIKKNASDLNIRFSPNKNGIIYYQNPYEQDMFLNIEDYFEFIKKKRVNELEMIANKLGAKHINVTIKEEKKSFVRLNAKKKNSLKGKVEGVNAGLDEEEKAELESKQFNILEIALDHNFTNPGNPERPDLVYFKGDPDIESLIDLQFGKNPSKDKKYTLKFSQSSDINLDIAAGIDAVLDKLSLKSSASVKAEVEREKRLYFDYFIEF